MVTRSPAFMLGGALYMMQNGTTWSGVNSPIFDGGVAANPYQLASFALPAYAFGKNGRKLPKRKPGEEIPESVAHLFA